MERERTGFGRSVVFSLVLVLTAASAHPGPTTRPGPAVSHVAERGAAETVTLQPIKDNTLFGEDSTLSNGSGPHLFTGSTAVGNLRRALIAFDIAGNVPAGSTITGASLALNLSRAASSTAVPVSLNRLLNDWGEGASDSSVNGGGQGGGGAGAPAEVCDATWTDRFFVGAAWRASGGDHEALASAALSVGPKGPYTWASDGMVSDLQSWLDDPGSNFGWVIIGEEFSSVTAKRFDSREHDSADVRPMLTVHYVSANTIEVNTTADGNDASPGDGACETGPGNQTCSLRAAIEEANALPGRDIVRLPAGTYMLTLSGNGEDSAATGDLDVTDSLTLVGDGAARTVVDGSAALDRVIHIAASTTAQISGVTISGGDVSTTRSANDGGAILNLGTLTLRDCSLDGNAAATGSAIFNDGGTLTMSSSTVSNNVSAEDGGTLENRGAATMTLVNSTASGNTGHAISNADTAALRLRNVTLADHTGSGIRISSATATTELSHTLLAGNAANSCGGDISMIASLGYNLDDGDTCGLTSTGDQVNTDPLLGPLQDNGGPTATRELLAGSPAVDGGIPGDSGCVGLCAATDQRGVERPQDEGCDVGAFEVTVEVDENQPPTANAGEDSTARCTSPDGGEVTLDGSGSSDPDSMAGNDDIVLFEWFLNDDPGDPTLLGTGETLDVVLPLGTHVVTLRVTDNGGDTDTDEVVSTVEDKVPPTISVEVTPQTLWPPNRRMVRIEARVAADDACGPPTVMLQSISSDEEGAVEGGAVRAAEMGQADFAFELQAERDGAGDGRVYTIVYTATDRADLSSSAEARVIVPHDQGRGRRPERGGGRKGRGD